MHRNSVSWRFVIFLFLFPILTLSPACDDDDSSSENDPSDDDYDDDLTDDDDSSDDDTTNQDIAIEAIDGGAPGSNGISVASGPDGTMYVAAVKARQLILYAYSEKKQVQSEILAPYATSPELSIDGGGFLHLIYRDFIEGSIVYSNNTSGTWVAEAVPFKIGVFLERYAADVDQAGNIHIIIREQQGLGYWKKESGIWQNEKVTNDGSIYGYLSIKLDENGKAHVSSFDVYEYVLKYSTNKNGAWETETIDDNLGEFSGENDLVLDADGKVHISYQYHNVQKYATNLSGSWSMEVVDSSDVKESYNAIAVDGAGNVHIGYYEWKVSNDIHSLSYSTNASGSWVTTSIDKGLNETNSNVAMAMDEDDKVHVVYFNDDESELRDATPANKSWQYTTIDSGGNVGEYSSMAKDENGWLHISYYDNSRGALMYADNIGGYWKTETADDATWAGFYSSLALDGDGFAHIVYWDYQNYNVHYTTNRSGAWVSEALETPNYGGGRTAIAVDSNNTVHLAYIDSHNYSLKYANNASGSWEGEYLNDGTTESGDDWDPSMRVDGNGAVHMTYYCHSTEKFYYAVNSSGIWNKEVIEEQAASGQLSSLYLDSAGAAHVSYIDNSINRVKYATNQSGSWVIEDVATSVANGGVNTSIALDDEGNVYIAYTDYESFKPKMAAKKDDEWIIETIDSYGIIGDHCSLVFGSDGLLHVSYYGEATLWHAAVNPDIF